MEVHENQGCDNQFVVIFKVIYLSYLKALFHFPKPMDPLHISRDGKYY